MLLCTTFMTLPVLFYIAISSLSSAVDNPNAKLHVSEEGRQRRSTWSAWRQLLKGAWRGEKYPNIRTYYKIGGKKDIMADFISLHPTNVFSVYKMFTGLSRKEKLLTLTYCEDRSSSKEDVWSGYVGQRKVAVSVQDLYSKMIFIYGNGPDHWRIKTVIQYIKRPEDVKHVRKLQEWEQLDLFKSKRRY